MIAKNICTAQQSCNQLSTGHCPAAAVCQLRLQLTSARHTSVKTIQAHQSYLDGSIAQSALAIEWTLSSQLSLMQHSSAQHLRAIAHLHITANF